MKMSYKWRLVCADISDLRINSFGRNTSACSPSSRLIVPLAERSYFIILYSVLTFSSCKLSKVVLSSFAEERVRRKMWRSATMWMNLIISNFNLYLFFSIEYESEFPRSNRGSSTVLQWRARLGESQSQISSKTKSPDQRSLVTM